MVHGGFCCAAGRAFGSLLAAFVVLLLAPGAAHAAEDFVVDRSDDPNLITTPLADNCTLKSRDCSLRGALTRSNASSATDAINFEVPDTEIMPISPTSPLPRITDTVTIDGYTQPGAHANGSLTNTNNAVLEVEISGAAAPSSADGLRAP